MSEINLKLDDSADEAVLSFGTAGAVDPNKTIELGKNKDGSSRGRIERDAKGYVRCIHISGLKRFLTELRE